uniref:NRPS condensation domain n=1 Tax=Streptoalloteichus sp. ATCC 53650 TaxID=756733 RepID=K4P117_9PSEU|nr:NRPS condensation domain [Streptoalloteichus sp. ATCC 53650]
MDGSHFALSLEQEFLRAQHEHDGSAGDSAPRLISSGGWRLTGELDLALFERALSDVVARHEALRTSVVVGPEGLRQQVHAPAPPPLEVRVLPDDPDVSRDERAEHFLNEIEGGTWEVGEGPAFRAFLGRFDDRDAVLVLVAHLLVVDVWSLSIVARDITTAYQARAAGREPEAADIPAYRDYAAKQAAQRGAGENVHAFWRDKLQGAEAIALTADRPPAPDGVTGTRCDRFLLDAELGAATREFAKASRCSLFMVLFAAYRLHLLRRTGMRDGVVWTLTSGPGRRDRWMENTVGYFVNMFPLRTDLAGCTTFREVVERTKATCVQALSREIPFVELASQASDAIGQLERGGMVVPGFQMSPYPLSVRAESAGGLSCTQVQRRLSQEFGPDIPDDAILWTAEVAHSGELLFAVNSSIDRYDRETIAAMMAEFHAVLRDGVGEPDAPLADTAR